MDTNEHKERRNTLELVLFSNLFVLNIQYIYLMIYISTQKVCFLHEFKLKVKRNCFSSKM